MSQYPLPLTLPPHYTRENFIISDGNKAASDWLNAWPNWPNHAFYLHGPEGSGKTHLGQIWLQAANAKSIDADALDHNPPQSGHWLIEDISDTTNTTALLHWLNYVREQGGTLLLTSRLPAAMLPFTLKDLTSRLLALPAAGLPETDDMLLEAALRKQCIDRQLKIDEDVITYLLPRMNRSLTQVQSLVARMDEAALAQRKHITIPFVRKLLED